jgi:hypothetical protein
MKTLLLSIILLTGIACYGQGQIHYVHYIEKEGWLYTVYWCINYLVECDRTTIDEFGREHYSTSLEYCVESREDCGHEKTFVNRDTAFMFHKKALNEAPDTTNNPYWMLYCNGCLTRIRVDSIWGIVSDTIIYDPPIHKVDSITFKDK